jgi:hypothetical protein
MYNNKINLLYLLLNWVFTFNQLYSKFLKIQVETIKKKCPLNFEKKMFIYK